MHLFSCRFTSPLMWFLALGATLLSAATPAFAVSPPEPPKGLSAPPQVTPMPAFELPGINGTKARSADLRNKVTVIRFWATWWMECVGEMPSVQRAHDSLRKHGIAVLTISLDGTGEQAVKPFMAKHRYTLPALVDPGMNVARAFGVRGVPSTVVVDRQGMIVARGFGPFDVDAAEFRQYLQRLAAK